MRVRLTLAFALVMAAVLAGAGAVVHARLADSLTAGIDRELSAQAARPAGRDHPGPWGGLDGDGPGPGVASQVLDASGAVLSGADWTGGRPLLSAAELARAQAGPITVERSSVPGVQGGVRLLAQPLGPDGEVSVVAASTRERDAALSQLRMQLVVGGLLALLLASAGGYGLAALALRPVERMRARAARMIARPEEGARLPVPPAHDEVRRLGDTLNELLGRLQDAVARERAFVADASHELRTPITVLRGELELIAEEGGSPEEVRAGVRSAAEEAERLAALADDLLVIARADQGRLALRIEPLDAAGLLARAARRIGRRAAEAGRPLIARAPEGLVIRGDEIRLEQALGNLADNALRHGAGTVELYAEPAGDGVRLGVRDAGPGFAGDFLPRAFERFSRADESRGDGGSGLGLAIVRVIAEAHGGTARAANRPRGGADVRLDLPRTAAVPSPPGPPARALPALSAP